MSDPLQQIRESIGDDPAKAMAALVEVREWVSKELPIPTHKATAMLVRISTAINVLTEHLPEAPQ